VRRAVLTTSLNGSGKGKQMRKGESGGEERKQASGIQLHFGGSGSAESFKVSSSRLRRSREEQQERGGRKEGSKKRLNSKRGADNNRGPETREIEGPICKRKQALGTGKGSPQQFLPVQKNPVKQSERGES